MRIASLGSGSRGNATLVDTGRSLVMVDCGLPKREILSRLGRRGVSAGDLDAILVTHEHSDHTRGVAALSNSFGLPVYLTAGTATSKNLKALVNKVLISPEHVFFVGDLSIKAEPVPHDAREPVQFCFECGDKKLGILTDLGCITRHLINAFSDCDALMLEFNHDPKLLEDSSYPKSVKLRVGGNYGHLTNHQARGLLEATRTDRLHTLFIAHISEQNNRIELVDSALATWSGLHQCSVIYANQSDGFHWHSLLKF